MATASCHSPPGCALGSRHTASAALAAASSSAVRGAGGRSIRSTTGIARTMPSGSGGISTQGPPLHVAPERAASGSGTVDDHAIRHTPGQSVGGVGALDLVAREPSTNSTVSR